MQHHQTVGIVGLGLVGQAIAKRLQCAQISLLGFDTSKAASDAFKNLQFEVAENLMALAQKTQILILCVFNSNDVQKIANQLIDFFKYAEQPIARKPIIPENTDDLVKLLLAANFLDIPLLISLLTRDLADRIYAAKTPDNIKNQVFNRPDASFTLAEERALLDDHPWLGTAPSGINFIY